MPVWVSCRDFQLHATIQRRHFDFAAQRRHGKVDRHFAVQVVAFTLEDGVLFHLHLNVQIACRCAVLARFAFAAQADAVAGIDASRDFNGQGFGFLNATVAVTFVARIFNQRAATVTVRTGLLYGEEALTHLYLAGTVTGWTGLRLGARFRAAAVANITLFQRRNADLFGDAANRLFQRQIHVVAQVGAAGCALTTATTAEDIAEHIAKDIAEVSTAATKRRPPNPPPTHAALFKGCVAVLVVGRTFLCIGQDFVGFFDLFKFGFSLFVTLVAVRVIFHGQALIRLFDFTLFRMFSERLKSRNNLALPSVFLPLNIASTGVERSPTPVLVINRARSGAIIFCL